MNKIKLLLLMGLIISCNSNKNQSKQKLKSGEQIVAKLDSLGFFNLTAKSEIEEAKREMAESKNEMNFFSGTLRDETLKFTDNRFFWIDCEKLFEVGGLTEYLEEIKPTFKKLGLKLDYKNEKDQQTDDFWEHTIELNGKKYIAFKGSFSKLDWGIAFANFITMLNDQLKAQNNKNKFFPIRGGNDGEMVLLTNEQFKIIKENYPNDDEHPKKLENWKRKNGI